jgi:hypothetical protein
MPSPADDTAALEVQRVLLGLAENDRDALRSAPWVGALVALGGMARRYVSTLTDRQLVVALSVPRRDFAAVLLGCGWTISAPPPRLDPPRQALRSLVRGTPIRAVTAQYMVEDHFEELLMTPSGAEAKFARSKWIASHLAAISPLPSLAEATRSTTPMLGELGRWAHIEGTWHERLAAQSADLAIVGTAARLREEVEARLAPRVVSRGIELETASPADTIANLLLPRGRIPSNHFSEIYSSARLADEFPLPSDVRCVILDGYGAIKYLAEIDSPFVFCVIDRSVANETSAELLIQYRNSRGEPVSLADALGWRAPVGVEALAFTTRL